MSICYRPSATTHLFMRFISWLVLFFVLLQSQTTFKTFSAGSVCQRTGPHAVTFESQCIKYSKPHLVFYAEIQGGNVLNLIVTFTIL